MKTGPEHTALGTVSIHWIEPPPPAPALHGSTPRWRPGAPHQMSQRRCMPRARVRRHERLASYVREALTGRIAGGRSPTASTLDVE